MSGQAVLAEAAMGRLGSRLVRLVAWAQRRVHAELATRRSVITSRCSESVCDVSRVARGVECGHAVRGRLLIVSV